MPSIGYCLLFDGCRDEMKDRGSRYDSIHQADEFDMKGQ
eukprot:CAMPEP_0201100860 /NCGR_PEP_ID=MMETSP0812-20130820/9678_1 /ASSEMBLY_ACC=CAM_ASM_000668 /TAXON_ID=98059 /ORGANISM="Dinobryon sp., Strain UTEXLB2267" /LENGTH=38 /DNA_ID= /DNA_START= /DNA_END= /DNA_ORIENTATION=